MRTTVIPISVNGTVNMDEIKLTNTVSDEIKRTEGDGDGKASVAELKSLKDLIKNQIYTKIEKNYEMTRHEDIRNQYYYFNIYDNDIIGLTKLRYKDNPQNLEALKSNKEYVYRKSLNNNVLDSFGFSYIDIFGYRDSEGRHQVLNRFTDQKYKRFVKTNVRIYNEINNIFDRNVKFVSKFDKTYFGFNETKGIKASPDTLYNTETKIRDYLESEYNKRNMKINAFASGVQTGVSVGVGIGKAISNNIGTFTGNQALQNKYDIAVDVIQTGVIAYASPTLAIATTAIKVANSAINVVESVQNDLYNSQLKLERLGVVIK